MIHFLLIVEVLSIVYGLYSEVGSMLGKNLPLTYLPPGMGWAIALIGATMSLVVKFVENEKKEREESKKSDNLLISVIGKVSVSVPTSEREFYALWSTQLKFAQSHVDVTHLGKLPPRSRHGEPETTYFSKVKELYAGSNAMIRRVERLTKEKIPWIEKFLTEFEGVENFSLTVYRDQSNDDLPMAISVSRIDDKYAWIVALAEHESTGGARDILLTGPEVVNLFKAYFQERLWKKGVLLMDRGVSTGKWDEIKRSLA